MATTKLLPTTFSEPKSSIARQKNIAADFSNWNQLLNNVNEIGKGSKKLSKKIDEKKTIIYKFSLQDTNLKNINKNINSRVESVINGPVSQFINAANAADDDKKNQRFILEQIKKNDIQQNLDFLRKRYRYYRYIQHQEIVEIEAIRIKNLEFKNSENGYLRSIGMPFFVSVSLTGVVAGISLLFISNIAAIPFWLGLCEKMLDSNISKVIFEATINIMSLFGLFGTKEILTLRTLYKDMMIETNTSDFKDINKEKIRGLIKSIFTSKEISKEVKDKSSHTVAFFSYINKCLKSRDIESKEAKDTISSIMSAKDMLFGTKTATVITGLSEGVAEEPTTLLSASTAFKFANFVYNNYNSPIFMWSFNMLGICKQMFKFVNISIDKLKSYPNSSDIIIFRDLTNSILSSYSSNELFLWISNSVSEMPFTFGKQITSSNIDWLLSPMKPIMDKVGPIQDSAGEYITPIKDYIKENISPVISDNISEIISKIKKYLTSYIQFTQTEISQQITQAESDQTKLEKDEEDDTNTIGIFSTKTAEILQEYKKIATRVSSNLEVLELIDKLKKCNSTFIEYLSFLYPTDGEIPPKSLAPKILSYTLTSISGSNNAELIQEEMTKLRNYYLGFFDEPEKISEEIDKLSGIKNRLIETQNKIKANKNKIYDLEKKKTGKEVEEMNEKIELLESTTDKKEIETSKQIKQNFKDTFNFEELQTKIDNFQKCFVEENIVNIKKCYEELTSYIINSANAEISSAIGKDFIQSLNQKMIDINKITDINELKKEGKTLLNDINAYFYTPLIEIMNQMIISKHEYFERIGKSQAEVEKMDEKKRAIELKRQKSLEKSRKELLKDKYRLQFIIGYQEKKQTQKEQLISNKESDIQSIVEGLIQQLAQEISYKETDITSRESLIQKLQEEPFETFKQTITDGKELFENNFISRRLERNELLSSIYDDYVAQILELSNNKNINEKEQIELETIIKNIKKFIDTPVEEQKTADLFIAFESISEYSNKLNSYYSSYDIYTKRLIPEFINENSKHLSLLFSTEDLISKSKKDLKLYSDIDDIIKTDGSKEQIIGLIESDIETIHQDQRLIVESIKKEISLFRQGEVENNPQILLENQLIDKIIESISKVNAKKQQIEKIKSDKKEILEFLNSKTYKPNSTEEAEKRASILQKDQDIEVLKLEIIEIQENIDSKTEKFNRPPLDIDSEIKKIRLQTARIMTTIKDKDTSYIGQLSSNGFIKSLIKTNVNTYLQTNKNVLVNMWFDKYIDKNEDIAYKEKISGYKKTAIMNIEEEILYMSKLSKTKTSKEISQILAASNVQVTKNPFKFKSPIMKYVTTLYSTYNKFLNDPTTMLYACYSTFTIQNIFSESFFYKFFGGVAGVGGTAFIQHKVLKGDFYKEYILKDVVKDIPVMNILFDNVLANKISGLIEGNIFLDIFNTKTSLKSSLIFLINIFFGSDVNMTIAVKTYLNNLIKEIMFDFDILFMELSSIIFNSKVVQSIYGYIENIMGKWLAGSFKITAKLTYKIALLPSMKTYLSKHLIPNKISLIQIINDPKQFGCLCQFINNKMFNILKYAKKLDFSNMFKQFRDLNGSDFYKDITTFLNTNNYFQVQKYDPRNSISNLNGNIITLKNKVSLNQDEYIIIDNDQENFKLISCNEIFDFVDKKLDTSFEFPGLKLEPKKPRKSEETGEETGEEVTGQETIKQSSIMEYLFMHYIREFKKTQNDKYSELLSNTDANEFDKKFKIEFNDFLVRESAKIYNNGNPNLVQYSLINKLMTLIDKNEIFNDVIRVQKKTDPTIEISENRFFYTAVNLVELESYDRYIVDFYKIYSEIDISKQLETSETETQLPITTKEETKNEITKMIKIMPIKELFERQGVGKINILVPYYDFWLRKITYKKTEVDFRDYLKVSQLLLFSMNDENSIQVTRTQLDALEELEAKTNNPELVDALKALNERFGTHFNSIKELRLNFEKNFYNALQLNYISFTSLGLDKTLFIRNLLNYDNKNDLNLYNDADIKALTSEIINLESVVADLRLQNQEITKKTKELTKLTSQKTILEDKLKIEPKSETDIQELATLETQIQTLNTTIENLQKLLPPQSESVILSTSTEIDNKRNDLSAKKLSYITSQIFPTLVKPGAQPNEKEENTKQYICFITNKISNINEECKTPIPELIKLLLQPESLLALKDDENVKNENLLSNEKSYRLEQQYLSSVSTYEYMGKFMNDYTETITSIDTKMIKLSAFLNETIEVYCPDKKNIKRGEFIFEESINIKYTNLSFDDPNPDCVNFKENFVKLKKQLDDLNIELGKIENVVKNLQFIDSTKLNDEDKKKFEEFKVKLLTREFRDLTKIKELIGNYNEYQTKDSIPEVTGNYLSFLYEISNYYQHSYEVNDQNARYLAGVLQNKKADLLSPDKHPLNYNLKRSEYEDVDTILYDLDVFFNELTKEAGYMSTKIKDESDAFVKSKSDEFAQSEKIKEARQKLYKKLGAFNILSTEVGNDENIKTMEYCFYCK